MQHHDTHRSGGEEDGAFLGGALVGLNDNGSSADLAPPVSPSADSTSISPSSRNGKRRDPDRPPRASNCWLLFRNAQLKQLHEDNPGMRKSQGELSKIISEMWKTCDPEVRAGYEALAKELRAEHARMYPDYRYAPAPRGSSGKAPKAKRSPSSRKPSLRLSPTQSSSSTGSFPVQHAFSGSSSAPSSAEPQYAPYLSTGAAEFAPASSSSTSSAYGSTSNPAPLAYVPYEAWTPPQTAAATSHHVYGEAARGPEDYERESLRNGSSHQQQQQQQHYQSYEACDRVPASAPATVTRFAGRSSGLTFDGAGREALSSTAFPAPTAYGLPVEHAVQQVPHSAAPTSFTFAHASQYMIPPPTAPLSSASSSAGYNSPHSSLPYPPPPALASPPRPQLRASYAPSSAEIEPSSWSQAVQLHRGSIDEPPPSPFILPPQQAWTRSSAQPSSRVSQTLPPLNEVPTHLTSGVTPLDPLPLSYIAPSALDTRPRSSSAASAAYSSTSSLPRPLPHPRTASYDSNGSLPPSSATSSHANSPAFSPSSPAFFSHPPPSAPSSAYSSQPHSAQPSPLLSTFAAQVQLNSPSSATEFVQPLATLPEHQADGRVEQWQSAAVGYSEGGPTYYEEYYNPDQPDHL
ncbi:hypothetical protein JCM8547_005050 [Rhodosporidiobolus lusitaniae]